MAAIKIKRALIAVYDKTGIAELAQALVDEFGIEIISTGGTAKHLKVAGIPVTMVEEVTGFPEMLDGRVKTLHPKIHAAILADRDNPEHMRQLAEHGIQPIDLVVVNLYPFEKTIAKPDCTFAEAIEMIDIGGPCLLRAAAKNHQHVLVVDRADSYELVLHALRKWGTEPERKDTLRAGAHGAFLATTAYDSAVATWLSGDEGGLPRVRFLRMRDWGELRYGENPHQAAEALRVAGEDVALVGVGQSIVELSFNNYLDADSALRLCAELTRSCNRSQPAWTSGAEPSGRAAARQPEASALSDVFAAPDPRMPAWFLTWNTYGSGLSGDDRGFVSRGPRADESHDKRNLPGSAYDAAQRDVQAAAQARMKGSPITLDLANAQVAEEAFLEAAKTHRISLIAYGIMGDHIHLLCQADRDGSELLDLFKGVASRRMGQSFPLKDAPRWWTEGGSKRFIKKGEDLGAVIEYVCSQQHPLLVRCFDESRNAGVPPDGCAARSEGRDSSAAQTAVQTADAARPEGRGSSIVCFIKHTNACGASVHPDPIEAYRRAYLGDPNAAMGGILAVNFQVRPDFAAAVLETYSRWGKTAGAGGFFVEVWLAPSFDQDAVRLIRGEVDGMPKKDWGKRVRLLEVGDLGVSPDPNEMDFKRITGGMLMQTRDLVGLNEAQWKVVTKRSPTETELDDLRLAWLVCKHTKSNAITLCRDGMLIGNGAGQMSRVMSCRIATWLARENGHADRLKGATAASDAFFPFRDGPDILMEAGITAIIQPGGSKRDDDTVAACDEHGVTMIFTGTRHFRH